VNGTEEALQYLFLMALFRLPLPQTEKERSKLLLLGSRLSVRACWRYPTHCECRLGVLPVQDLPPRERASERADLEVSVVEGTPDLLVGMLAEGVEVGAHGALEQERVLGDHREAPPQVLQACRKRKRERAR